MVRASVITRSTPTMRDVAKLAGVSQATVSYIINGRKGQQSRISKMTEERVRAAMTELNYVPNDAARHLRRNHSDRICLVIGGLGSPFGEALVGDVERVAATYGYSLTIALGGSAKREQQVIQQIRQRMADGLIIESASSPTDDLRALARSGVPLVVMSNRHEPDGFDVVATTELDAVTVAITSLLEKGHVRFGVVVHTAEREAIEPRVQCVRDTLASAGIPLPDEMIVTGAESRTKTFGSVRALLSRADRPTALYSTSDIGAISALWAAQSLNLRVPDDLAVAGTGNIAEGEITQPALSTIGAVHQPFTEIAEMLFQRLTGAAPPEGRRMVIPWTFFPRGTS